MSENVLIVLLKKSSLNHRSRRGADGEEGGEDEEGAGGGEGGQGVPRQSCSQRFVPGFRIRIKFNADPDPAFFLIADPDPGFERKKESLFISFSQ
jgi:hypothetical protein